MFNVTQASFQQEMDAEHYDELKIFKKLDEQSAAGLRSRISNIGIRPIRIQALPQGSHGRCSGRNDDNESYDILINLNIGNASDAHAIRNKQISKINNFGLDTKLP
jgi:hypothetical protein